MKIRNIIIFIILLLGMGVFNSCKEASCENSQNIKNVEIGMDTLKVLEIMGQPISKRNYKGELYYDYEAPAGLSVQYQIIFNSQGNVVFISPSPDNFDK
ncbi:hypothetical protein [Algoriphagus algorifonticola]|uniref:hypothetical protein n=1 Tax=Algoriphagus algorifonticola TaxID=2593007 RepID=UPI0011A7536E|nr:hypothetical protein [Algoriphagus algorifonticola]